MLHDIDRAADETGGVAAKRQLGALRCSEKVGHEREGRTRHILEQKGGTFARDHPPVDLGCLEPRIDSGLNLNQVAFKAKGVQEFAKIGGHGGES